MENRILKLCFDILKKGNEFVDCGAIDCDCCPFDGENCCLARIGNRVEGGAIAEAYIKKYTQEERNSTEKTFREVIADIKEGEVWERLGIKIIKDSDSIQMLGFDHNTIFMDSSKIFNLQRKEYTFEEAYKSTKEGLEIESLVSGIKYKKYDEDTMMFKDRDMDDFSGIDNDGALFSVDEINGKWYINN